MEERVLTCIGCPQGCQITVTLRDGRMEKIEGNTCKVGEQYAQKEITAPERTVTSTVKLMGSRLRRLPVRTAAGIPKDKVMECMREVNRIEAKVPVRRGDVLLRNAAGTGVDIIATRDVTE